MRFMSTTDPGGMGYSGQGRPHAYDPLRNPELFEGVLARRVIAFIIDAIVISVPVILFALFILVFGLITLGRQRWSGRWSITASRWAVRIPPPWECA
jgi:uncharacterized RDD family membrane protein YckC